MLFISDKIFLFLLCLFPFLGRELSPYSIGAVLGAVIVSCLCQALAPNGNKQSRTAFQKNAKSVTEALYCFLSILFPQLIAFLPLTVYEAVRTRDIVPLVFGGISVFFALSQDPLSAAYPLLLSALAVFACLKTLNNMALRESGKKNRDTGAELEKIMKRRNRELQENLDYEIHIAALNERNRIAREIHDNVGHLLSRSLLQTGALSAICPKDQTAMKASIDGLKSTLDSAMNSIRESVHGIWDDALDLKVESRKMLSPLADKFSVSLDYDIGGELPMKIKLCFISVMKEAISNISRHSNGDRVEVTLREHPSLYQLIIFDNGTEYKEHSTEGMGLSNMRERVESMGGNFRIKGKGGFTVFASVRKDIL